MIPTPLESVLIVLVIVLYLWGFRLERIIRAYHKRLSALNFTEAELERLAGIGGEIEKWD